MSPRKISRNRCRQVSLLSAYAIFTFLFLLTLFWMMAQPRLNLSLAKNPQSQMSSFYVQTLKDKDISCYDDKSTRESLELFESNDQVQGSIFFHETSCFGESGISFNARQACAVESAAKMNPNTTVYLLFLSPSKLSNGTQLLFNHLTKYKNIKIRRILVNDYVRNTPLETWFSIDNLKNTNWPIIQVSDIIRLITMWKYGGIYLDLDVVVMKSMEGLTNFVGAQDRLDVASGVMGFSTSGFGHEVVTMCLKDLQENFQGDVWGKNGPEVITRVLRNLCNVISIEEMTQNRCGGFKVFPPFTFYPIHYGNWQDYFEGKNLESKMQVINEATAIHVWNKLSKHRTIRVGERVPYTIVAEKYCPEVYHNCGSTF